MEQKCWPSQTRQQHSDLSAQRLDRARYDREWGSRSDVRGHADDSGSCRLFTRWQNHGHDYDLPGRMQAFRPRTKTHNRRFPPRPRSPRNSHRPRQ